MALPQEQIFTEDDYYNLPEDVHAELIDGQFYSMSAPSRIHQGIISVLNSLIFDYIRDHHGNCRVYPSPFAVKLFPNEDTTIVEPDISVICDPDKLTDKGCTGAPDWIIEIISPSNSENDYIRKLGLYQRAGVREYWIINPLKNSVLVYRLETVQIQPDAYTFQDMIPCGIYEDLTLNFPEISSLL